VRGCGHTLAKCWMTPIDDIDWTLDGPFFVVVALGWYVLRQHSCRGSASTHGARCQAVVLIKWSKSAA
jgi:hypothetical protein